MFTDYEPVATPLLLALASGFAAGLSFPRWAPLVPPAVVVVWAVIVASRAGPVVNASGDNPIGYIVLEAAVSALVGEFAVAIAFLVRRRRA